MTAADARWQSVHDAIEYARGNGADEAHAAILAVLDLIKEPTVAQMVAANELPITQQINGMISVMAMRNGDFDALPGEPDSPLQQWYRAMIAVLIEGAK